MRRVDEEHAARARLGLSQAGFEFFFLNVACTAGSALAGSTPVFNRFMPQVFFKNSRTGVGERVRPVRSRIAAMASLMDAGGWSRK